ncbi:MAG: tail fiber domain-containing protein [Bacteroidota bacterium]
MTHLRKLPVPLHLGFDSSSIVNDGKTDNALTLRLSNLSDEYKLDFTNALIEWNFLHGVHNRDYLLGTLNQVDAIIASASIETITQVAGVDNVALDTTSFLVTQLNKSRPEVSWELKPALKKNPALLPWNKENASILLKFSGIKSNYYPGTTYLFVTISGVIGVNVNDNSEVHFGNTKYKLAIEKLPWTVKGSKIGIGTQDPAENLHVVTPQFITFENNTGGEVSHKLVCKGINAYVSHGGWGMGDSKLGLGGQHHTNADLVIDTKSGNVGISKANPSQKLDVNGNMNCSGYLQFPNADAGKRLVLWEGLNNSYSGIGKDPNSTTFSICGASDYFLFVGYNTLGQQVEMMRIVYNGGSTHVGINRNNPQAPLHVQGYGTRITHSALIMSSDSVAAGPNWTVGNWNSGVCAIFEGDVVSYHKFVCTLGPATFSDQRFKNVIGQSDSKADLEVLKKVQVTDFRYIDQITLGNDVIKKVIAQQLEEIIPSAVRKITSYIPDIYTKAKAIPSGNGSVIITLEKPHNLLKGDKVKWYHLNNTSAYNSVSEIHSEFCFELDIADDIKDLFIYGKEVNDFRTVDYDTITMLNVSATQELSRKTDSLETEVAELKTENAKLKNVMLKLEEEMKHITSYLREQVRNY